MNNEITIMLVNMFRNYVNQTLKPILGDIIKETKNINNIKYTEDQLKKEHEILIEILNDISNLTEKCTYVKDFDFPHYLQLIFLDLMLAIQIGPNAVKLFSEIIASNFLLPTLNELDPNMNIDISLLKNKDKCSTSNLRSALLDENGQKISIEQLLKELKLNENKN